MKQPKMMKSPIPTKPTPEPKSQQDHAEDVAEEANNKDLSSDKLTGQGIAQEYIYILENIQDVLKQAEYYQERLEQQKINYNELEERLNHLRDIAPELIERLEQTYEKAD